MRPMSSWYPILRPPYCLKGKFPCITPSSQLYVESSVPTSASSTRPPAYLTMPGGHRRVQRGSYTRSSVRLLKGRLSRPDGPRRRPTIELSDNYYYDECKKASEKFSGARKNFAW